MRNDIMARKSIPKSVRQTLAAWGRKGGRAGSRKDKVLAGKAGYRARMRRLTEQARRAAMAT